MRSLMLCVLALSCGGFAISGETPFDGKPSAVTVYTSNLARVTRSGSVAFGKGETIIRSSPLPPEADSSSLQAGISASGVRIMGMEIRSELPDEKELETKLSTHRKQLKDQEDKLFTAQQAVRAVDDSIRSQEEKLAFVDKMRTAPAAKNAAEMQAGARAWDAAEWEKAFALAEKNSEEARSAMRELALKRRQAEEIVAAEHLALEELRRKGPRASHQARAYVTLAAEAQGEAMLNLSYVVTGAEWRPSYRARADIKAGSLDMDINASIRQSTGEDWDQVALSFSTARPDLGTDVPRLSPWYLKTAPTIRSAEDEVRKKPKEIKEPEPIDVPGLAEEDNGQEDGDAVSSGVATVFAAESLARIPSDNQTHCITIASFKSPISIERIAIPKIQPHAFILATSSNKAPYPLLPGAVDVVVGGNFVGRGWIKLTSPGEALKLGLGVDEGIRISLTLLEDKVERKRKGERTATTNAFAIEAANFSAEEVELVIYDQLPISQSANIIVTYGQEARRAARGAEFPGQLKWTMTLQPQKTGRVEFDFTIEFPESMRQELSKYNDNTLQRAYSELDYAREKKEAMPVQQSQAKF